MIQILLFKKKEKERGEGRFELSGQWKVPMFGGQWKVPMLSGQWKVAMFGGPRKVPMFGGQLKEKEKHLFTSFHFPLNKFYLNLHFFF